VLKAPGIRLADSRARSDCRRLSVVQQLRDGRVVHVGGSVELAAGVNDGVNLSPLMAFTANSTASKPIM
jgi:hypothetical protein